MVHKENWLAVVGAKFLPPAGTNNLVPISYYVIEDILSATWIKTLELRQHPMGYTITVDSVGQMLADLDAKGISWPGPSFVDSRNEIEGDENCPHFTSVGPGPRRVRHQSVRGEHWDLL